ncbi:unnamed protein product, partial [Meganyctiphanes norvegica]
TIFRDQPSNWTDAVKRCQSEGLVLAEPTDTVAVPLRRFLLERYGDGSFWVNARGNQRKIMWQRGNKALEDDSPLWSGQPEDRVTPSYCLSLLAWYEDWLSSPGQPYYSRECSNTYNYPLCERILEDKETLKSPIIALAENISITLDFIETSLIDSINMYNISIDRLLQDTQIMKEPLLVLEENLSTKLESVEKNISTSLVKIDQDTQSIEGSLLDLEGNLSKKLESVGENISSALENLDQKRIRFLSTHDEGFCMSSQCFTLLNDVQLNWSDAKAKCEEIGFILAQPSHLIARRLRRYLTERHGDAQAHLGAKGDGSKFVWQHGGGTALMADSNLLRYGKGNAGTDRCLEVDAETSTLSSNPDKPYDSIGCAGSRYPLCE